MRQIVKNLVLGAIAILMGCGSPPAMHPLKLVSPPQDCSQKPQPCYDYLDCYQLGINLLHITVGPSHPEDTSFLCTVAAPAILTQVYYQPGQDSYTIEASYDRGGSTVQLSAGPFTEDETQTPWILPLH